jgi:outer membrane immunogenic protein
MHVSLPVAVVALAIGASTAAYADGYPAPYGAPYTPLSWAGYYVGANIGGSWMQSDATWQATTFPTFKAQLDSSGVIGGVQTGRNWQFGSIVLGIESDIAARHLEANGSIVVLGVLPVTITEKQDWLGTVRGRLGYAMGSWLVYGTGGFAYGDLAHHVTETVAGVSVLAAGPAMREGWAAGGGVEWAINPRWSVGAEYIHVDLGSVNVAGPLGISTTRFEDQSDIVRAKLNFRFGEDRYVPLK